MIRNLFCPRFSGSVFPNSASCHGRTHWFVFFTAAFVEIKSITRHPMDKWCVARSVMPLWCSVSREQLYSTMMTDGDQWLLHSKWICFFSPHAASLFTFSSSSFIQGGFITLCILWKRGLILINNQSVRTFVTSTSYQGEKTKRENNQKENNLKSKTQDQTYH